MSKFKITFQAKLVKDKFYLTMRINLALKDRFATKKAVKKGKTINSVVTIKDNYKSVYVGIPISFKEKSEWNSAIGRFNGTDLRNIQLDNLQKLSSEVVEKNIQLIDYYNTTILKELIKNIVLGKRTKEFKLQVQAGKIYDTERQDKYRFPISKTHPRQIISGDVESIVQDLSSIVTFQRDKQALLKMSLATFIENTWKEWKKTKKKADDTARTYQNSVSWIKKFEKANKRLITVADFNQTFAEEYYLWAKRQRKTDGKPYKVNYISDLRKQLQLISGELKSVYGHNTNIDWKSGDTLKKSREKSVDIALNKNQIKQLFGYKIPDAAPKGMQHTLQLETKTLSNGIYILKFYRGADIITKKMTITL